MIFLSHNRQDKPVVEQVAQALAHAFGRENVFYDSWSIQPGDGIIEKMNQGLAGAKFLFLFVSKNSLASNMVSLEWQNGLYKSVKGDLRIVPIRLDDAGMPALLMQTLYIDMVNHGVDVATRQMIDVVSGVNTYRAATERFENVRAYLSESGGKTRLEIRAEAYMEPQSRYVVLFPKGVEEPQFQLKGDTMSEQGMNRNVALSDGRVIDGLLLAVSRATSLNFPVVAEFEGKPPIIGVMRAVSHDQWQQIPLINTASTPRVDVNFGTASSLAESPLTRG